MALPKNKLTAAMALCSAGTLAPAFADFDQWRINEIFSSADGSIQFVELLTTAGNQGTLSGQNLVSSDAAAQPQGSLSFTSDLSGDTANSTLLLATQGFVDSTGLSADFILPDGFLNPLGGGVDFAGGTDSLSYNAGDLPLNGQQSLGSDGAVQTASPTNFTGLDASLNVAVNATFDALTGVFNLPVLDVPGFGVANVSFDVNLNTVEFTLRNDFFLFGPGIVAGDTAAQLQGTTLYVPRLLLGNQLLEFNLDIVNDNPITFANPVVLSVTDVPPEAEPEPEPEPEPNPLQESINRGQSLYASICATCHGVDGFGGVQLNAPNLRTSGFNTFAGLRQEIDLTMPFGNSGQCQDTATSTCATDVANYVLNVFQGSLNSAGPGSEDVGY